MLDSMIILPENNFEITFLCESAKILQYIHNIYYERQYITLPKSVNHPGLSILRHGIISLTNATSLDKKKYITRTKHESGTQYGSKERTRNKSAKWPWITHPSLTLWSNGKIIMAEYIPIRQAPPWERINNLACIKVA